MRRAWHISAWTLGSVLTLIVALVAAVLVAGNTVSGRVVIERSIARISDGHVQLSGLSGSFPAAIKLGQLQLADERGAWLTAEGISLRWSPLALLTRHLKVERLQLARLDIERRPVTAPSQNSNRRFPHVDIGQLSIDTFELGPQLAGVRATLSVEGSAHLFTLEDARAILAAHRTDNQGDYQIRLRSEPSGVDATLRLEEPAGGALANLLPGYRARGRPARARAGHCRSHTE